MIRVLGILIGLGFVIVTAWSLGNGVYAAVTTTTEETVEHRHGVVAGEMVVADSRFAHAGVARPRLVAPRAECGRHAHDRFQHCRDFRACQSIIAVTALRRQREKPALHQFRKMRARRRQADAGLARQFRCGQRAAVHQRRQHVGAGRVSHQAGDAGNIGRLTHGSTVNEAFL